MFKGKKNQLDEMQEQKLLHIEKNGCWFCFWSLVVAIFIQMAVCEDAATAMIGEWIIFMSLCVYMGIACIKNGIWDRKLEASPKTNAVISAIAGIFTGLALGVINYMQYGFIKSAIWTGVFNLFFVGILCFVALSVIAAIYKKRLQKMEMEEEE